MVFSEATAENAATDICRTDEALADSASKKKIEWNGEPEQASFALGKSYRDRDLFDPRLRLQLELQVGGLIAVLPYHTGALDALACGLSTVFLGALYDICTRAKRCATRKGTRIDGRFVFDRRWSRRKTDLYLKATVVSPPTFHADYTTSRKYQFP